MTLQNQGRQPRTTSLSAIAARQHGLFTTAQARHAGYSIGAVRYRVRSGSWRAVDHGVYTTAETPLSWNRRVLAACLAGPAVASHRSAASLWELPGFSRSMIEVTALRHRRRHAHDVVWHESVRLGDREVLEIDGVPTTDAVRTIIDLGSVCDDGMLLEALDDAVRRKLATVHTIERRLQGLGPLRRGSGRVRRALARRSPSSPVPASVLESRFDVLVSAAGLPIPDRQHQVRDATGTLVARVDFAYVEARIVIEIDGLRYHAGPDDWRADVQRQTRLGALGWIVLRFSAADIELRPREVAAAIRNTLGTTMRP